MEYNVRFDSTKIKDKLINFLLTVSIILGVLNIFMYIMQPRMVFFPYPFLEGNPQDWGLRYEDVTLTTTDKLRLHAWYIPAARTDTRKTLLFVHGNAGNISHRRDSIMIFQRLGLNVLIFDYRGYGKSEGSPSEDGIYEDAMTAWRYLTDQRNIAGKDIIVFGRSLGGVVATELSGQVQPGGLIVESSFSSARDMAGRMFPILHYGIYLRYRFNAADTIKTVNSPVLILHSPQDEIIPFTMGQKIFSAANPPKQWHELTGDHNTGFLLQRDKYENVLKKFLASL